MAAVSIFDIQPSQGIVSGFYPAEYLRFNMSFGITSDQTIKILPIYYAQTPIGVTAKFEEVSFNLMDARIFTNLEQNVPTHVTLMGWVRTSTTSPIEIVLSGFEISSDGGITSAPFFLDTPVVTHEKLLRVIPEPSSCMFCFLGFGLLIRRSR